jgi:hypothetical protein
LISLYFDLLKQLPSSVLCCKEAKVYSFSFYFSLRLFRPFGLSKYLHVVYESISNIQISGNTITSSNVGWEPASSLIRVFRNVTTVPHEKRFMGVRVTNNTLSNSRGGIFISHVGLLPGVQQYSLESDH